MGAAQLGNCAGEFAARVHLLQSVTMSAVVAHSLMVRQGVAESQVEFAGG